MSSSDAQLLLPLIAHEVEGEIIRLRAKDGYVNATAMCKAAGREWRRYSRLDSTREYVAALETATGIRSSELIQTLTGGHPQLQGTWVHPQVAIHLAQWLSPEFAVKVSEWVFEWLSGGPKVVERLPYHLRRYVANLGNVPRGHFSVLQELTYNLIAPLEARGYHLPDHMVPDISQGRMFAGWLRNEKGIDPAQFPSYRHQYEDGRIVDAKAYPNALKGDFSHHFETVWMPNRAIGYFRERDPEAVPHLQVLLAAPEELAALAATTDTEED